MWFGLVVLIGCQVERDAPAPSPGFLRVERVEQRRRIERLPQRSEEQEKSSVKSPTNKPTVMGHPDSYEDLSSGPLAFCKVGLRTHCVDNPKLLNSGVARWQADSAGSRGHGLPKRILPWRMVKANLEKAVTSWAGSAERTTRSPS